MHLFYNGNPCIAKISIEEFFDSSDREVKRRGYNLRAIKIEAVNRSSADKASATTPQVETTSTSSISDLFSLVKQYDKELSPKPVNPLMLKEDGTPKVFYHGTKDMLTEFKKQDKHKFGSSLGNGFYFTEDYERAFKYANGLFSNGQDRGGIIMPVYLRITNPFIIDSNNKTRWHSEILDSKTEYDGIVDQTNGTYYTEMPENIKSATDNTGTFDGNNPDIRYFTSSSDRYYANDFPVKKKMTWHETKDALKDFFTSTRKVLANRQVG